MIFRYEAMDQSGSEIRDTVEADTEHDAAAKIRGMGYFATRISQQGEPSTLTGHPDVSDDPSPTLRRVVTFGPVVLLAVCLACLYVPLSYGWNHDELSALQVIKANWKSSLAGGAIFCVLSVWVRLRKWAEGGCQ